MCVVDINSLVCCLAAPGDHEGAARQHTRELMSPTHTYPWLIPIVTWCGPFPFVPTNILLIKIKLKLESRAAAVILVASIAVAPHPRPRTCTRQFLRNQSVLIELHQSGVIAWRPRQHRRWCGVFKSWIFVAHCHFERKWRVLHIWYISVLEQVGMSFNGIAHLMKV